MSRTDETIFGRPLGQLPLTRDGVPSFLPGVSEFLRAKAATVGIFRLCGNHKIVQDLGRLFTLPECPVPPCASVHDLAAFLKKWLRELPEPLIPPLLLNVVYDPDDSSTFVPLLNSLQIPARKSLALISGIVAAVLENQAVNQMGASNMITCFAGSFLQESKDLERPLHFHQFMTKCAECLNEKKDDFTVQRLGRGRTKTM
jgi:hypothetical protein